MPNTNVSSDIKNNDSVAALKKQQQLELECDYSTTI